MLNSICLPHVFNQHDARLKLACEEYYSIPIFKKEERRGAKKSIDVAMKLFFEAVEMLGQYNFDRTKELLQWIRDNPSYPKSLRDMIWKNGIIPNCQQLSANYIKFSGSEIYAEKWSLLGKEVIKVSNFKKARIVFGKNARLYECCIQFVRDGGLEKFCDLHKEFLRVHKKEKGEECISDEFLVLQGEACVNCKHNREENVFDNVFLQEIAA